MAIITADADHIESYIYYSNKSFKLARKRPFSITIHNPAWQDTPPQQGCDALARSTRRLTPTMRPTLP
ncbi:MAG: hypothetical protein Q4F13_01015 [Pseudomonadota bacterium]|nr:hypothetical protein [Pseudomonadota bacterium]